jgi:hypothetical protein
MVRFVTQNSGTCRDVPRGDDVVIARADNTEKRIMNQQAASRAIGGRGIVGRNNHAINPLPPSVDRRFDRYASDNTQQQQQQRGDPPEPISNKSALTKVQHYIMASRIARHQEEMQKAALKAQKKPNVRPPLPPPPPQQMIVRKQRVITPEMVARRPVESKHNIMMRSRHKTCNDSVSNSIVSDSTNQIENTKKAVAQRKRDDLHRRSTIERNANTGVGTPTALAQLVAALSVNRGSNPNAKDDQSSSNTAAKSLSPNNSPSAKNTSSPIANEEFKRSISTKSDDSGSSIITEEEIIRKPSSQRRKHAGPEANKNSIDFEADRVNIVKADILIPKKTGLPKDDKNSIDSQTGGVNSTIYSKAKNLTPKKTESPKEISQLVVDTDPEPTQSVGLSPFSLSTKSDLSKDSLVTEAEIVLQPSSPRENDPLLRENKNSICSKTDGVRGNIIKMANDLISKGKESPKRSAQLMVDTELQPAQPSSVLSPVLKEDIETQLPFLSLEPQIPVQPVTNVESKYEADDSEDGKDSSASDDYREGSEASPEVSSLGTGKFVGGSDYSKEENPMKLDTKSNKKTNLRLTPPEKSCATKMGRSNVTPPKRSRLLGKYSNELGMKPKVIVHEREYAAEEKEDRVDLDDEVSDEPEETNQVQRHSTMPSKRSTLQGKNFKDSKRMIPKKSTMLGRKSKVIEEEREYAAEEKEDRVDLDDVSDELEKTNQVQRNSTTPPTRSRLLGKNSKDSKRMIPKKSTLLGRKSKVIEEEREYAAEEEEEYPKDEDDEVRDAPEELNQVQRLEEESFSDSFSASMKSTLSKAEYISVESSITTDQNVFAQKAGVLKRTASLVKNPGRTMFNRNRSKAEKEGEELMKSMRHGMTVARADNRKKERFPHNSNPVKNDDCTPDSEEMVYGNITKVMDDNDMLNNNSTYDGDSMYEDNTDFIPKTVATKSRGAINSGTQTRMNEQDITFPIIRTVSSGIKEMSSFQSLKETATQTSIDHFVAPLFSPTKSPTEHAISDDFVLPPSTAGPEIIKSEVGTVSHLMESFALCGAKVCMGTSNAMLSCADSCGDDPQGRKMMVLSPRHNVAPAHIVRQPISPTMAPQRCAMIHSCYNINAEPQPSSNTNNTDQEVAGIFTRAFAMALNGMSNGKSDTETTKERELPSKQQNTESPQPHLDQHVKESDKLDDFLSIDGMFMSPNRQHGRHSISVPHKIAVKPKKRRHAAGINEMEHSAAVSPRKPKKLVQICEDEMKNCVSWSDQMDDLGQDLTRTNSLIRASSNGSKTGKSKGVRGFFNKMGKMRIGFTYEV